MHDTIEHPALFLVVEDDVAKRLAVQRAVRLEDALGAKMPDDRAQREAAGLDGDAGEDVEVDDGHAMRLEEVGHGRLAWQTVRSTTNKLPSAVRQQGTREHG